MSDVIKDISFEVDGVQYHLEVFSMEKSGEENPALFGITLESGKHISDMAVRKHPDCNSFEGRLF